MDTSPRFRTAPQCKGRHVTPARGHATNVGLVFSSENWQKCQQLGVTTGDDYDGA